MNTTSKSLKPSGKSMSAAFTLVDLLTVIVVLAVLGLLLAPALARTQPDARVWQCLNNHAQMCRAWRMYADDYSNLLLAAEELGGTTKRVIWSTGFLDISAAASNWDVNQDLAKSPILPYLGKNAYSNWKCPADLSTVAVQGKRLPRVRSISMSQTFGKGYWLPSPQYRVYGKADEIAKPAQTFVFTDEHPDSINDASFAMQMALPTANTAAIIDFPASHHDGACSFSFADGHAEVHRWIGSKLKPKPTYTGLLALNLPAGDSVQDIIWLSSVTTVAK